MKPSAPPGSRLGITTAHLVLGALALLVVAGLAVFLAVTPPAPVALHVDAEDASGRAVAVPVRIDGELVGTTPISIEGRWTYSDAEFDEPGADWPGPLPPGSTPFSRVSNGARHTTLETSPYIDADGALVVRLRAVRGDRVVTDELRLEVGEPGALARPTRSGGGGGTSGLRSESLSLRYGFEVP